MYFSTTWPVEYAVQELEKKNRTEYHCDIMVLPRTYERFYLVEINFFRHHSSSELNILGFCTTKKFRAEAPVRLLHPQHGSEWADPQDLELSDFEVHEGTTELFSDPERDTLSKHRDGLFAFGRRHCHCSNFGGL